MKRIVAIGMTALALAAVLGGLWTVGGPGYARKVKNDQTRSTDLGALVRELKCDEGTAPETLPVQGDVYCTGLFSYDRDIHDPVTKTPYRYTRLDDNEYTICADFELPDELKSNREPTVLFDATTGCMTGQVRF